MAKKEIESTCQCGMVTHQKDVICIPCQVDNRLSEKFGMSIKQFYSEMRGEKE